MRVAGGVAQGGGDAGVAGQAEDADDQVPEGGHDVGPVPVRAVEASSPKVTSRTQTRLLGDAR